MSVISNVASATLAQDGSAPVTSGDCAKLGRGEELARQGEDNATAFAELDRRVKQREEERLAEDAEMKEMANKLETAIAKNPIPTMTRLDRLEKRVLEMDQWAIHINQVTLLQKRVSELEQSCAQMRSQSKRKRRDDYDYEAFE